MNKPVLVFIVPCFNEEVIIQKTYNILQNTINQLVGKDKISSESYISFIDDGSTDKTWAIIKDLPNVCGIKFEKNFGHQSALLAGLMNNNADIYIPVDADLQDDISVTEEMIDKYLQGANIVFAIRKDRKNADNICKRITAFLFYEFLKLLSPKTIPNSGDFCLLDKSAVSEIANNISSDLYLRGLIQTLDFKKDKVYYIRQKRIGGTNKYTFFKSFALACSAFLYILKKNRKKTDKVHYIIEEIKNK